MQILPDIGLFHRPGRQKAECGNIACLEREFTTLLQEVQPNVRYGALMITPGVLYVAVYLSP